MVLRLLALCGFFCLGLPLSAQTLGENGVSARIDALRGQPGFELGMMQALRGDLLIPHPLLPEGHGIRLPDYVAAPSSLNLLSRIHGRAPWD